MTLFINFKNIILLLNSCLLYILYLLVIFKNNKIKYRLIKFNLKIKIIVANYCLFIKFKNY